MLGGVKGELKGSKFFIGRAQDPPLRLRGTAWRSVLAICGLQSLCEIHR